MTRPGCNSYSAGDMRAAVLIAPETFEIRELPRPQPGSDEVLIRVTACAVCGTDLRIFRHGHARVQLPAVIGHEIVGVVEELGAGLQDRHLPYTAGQKVMITPGIACGLCDNCLRGRFCTDKTAIGYHHPGGFAEYVLVPARGVLTNILPLPDPLPAGQEAADYTPAEPLACALNGLEQLGELPLGGSALVVGAGAIGVMMAKLLARRGLGCIALADLSADRLALAERLLPAATTLINNAAEDLPGRTNLITGGTGFDLVVVACSSPEMQEQALDLAGLYGRILFFAGLPPGRSSIRFDSNRLHYKLISVHGTYGSTIYQNRLAVRLIAGGFTRGICDSRYSLEGIDDAFRNALTGSSLKTVIEI